MSALLADLTWPDAELVAADAMLAVPMGSTEQRGPHLPLSTDTDIAVAIAGLLAQARPTVVVAPRSPSARAASTALMPRAAVHPAGVDPRERLYQASPRRGASVLRQTRAERSGPGE